MKRIEVLLALTLGCLIFMGYVLADQFHPAEEVQSGIFGGTKIGDYKFPRYLTINKYLKFSDGSSITALMVGGIFNFQLGKSPGYFNFMDSTANTLLRLDNAGNLWVKGTVNVEGDLNVKGKIYGWNVPSNVKVTSITHDGNFGGYKAMNDWIQNYGDCKGYHVCDATELTRWAQSGGATPNEVCWYNSGIWSIMATNWVADCEGWTSSSLSATGLCWYTSNKPYKMDCIQMLKVCCCK
jgi:hypothetical protein